MALVEIDGAVTHDTLQSIRAMLQVVRADYLQFSADRLLICGKQARK